MSNNPRHLFTRPQATLDFVATRNRWPIILLELATTLSGISKTAHKVFFLNRCYVANNLFKSLLFCIEFVSTFTRCPQHHQVVENDLCAVVHLLAARKDIFNHSSVVTIYTSLYPL